ncbi:acyltransferase family protein [Burkholderia ubonensis]|uniref:acyltransferase family protein n=1 Tax=Burkholderia ubonensis TaxID=101571 RepID=UPI00075BEAB5|nr:acyltransferase [Burkholderia ubonensis]KVZ91217.1 hypothetical protein WL25_20070 [Burkholderia ubonensis]KWD54563.1 hypothetical protein WL67_13460 [Burkholderia ubonensis]KWD65903.1 hypothetical protein WL66_27640 [Burkholderia ubonensis]
MQKTIKALDGLRGAATLLVVFYHVDLDFHRLTYARSGYLAVDLFFVLSGFVICGAYGAKMADGPSLMAFMVRRFGRLWPTHVVTSILYYCVANAVFGIAALFVTGRFAIKVIPTPLEIVAQLTMSQGLNLFNHVIGTGVNWSTGDEFYVYILFGALCLFARGKLRLAAFGAMALIGYVVTVWVSYVSHHCAAGYRCMDLSYDYGWARCLAGFFIGALLAEFRDSAPVRALRTGPMQCAALAVSALIVAFAFQLPGLALAAPIAFAVLVGSLSGDSGLVSALLNTSPFQYLGRVSYSLYLSYGVFGDFIHVGGAFRSPLDQGLVLAAFFYFSFALAHTLYNRVEAPCRARFHAWADRISGNPSRTVSAG